MLDLKRNNLDRSFSPYLQQHRSQAIWWQEWSTPVLEAAQNLHKPLLISIGYATCHWCHVMADGAFADPATTAFLNQHFICIKIDRELRPDIDQVMMQFLVSQQGSGGWPLNVFLTPDLKPVYALTYAPAQAIGQMPAFITICRQVLQHIQAHQAEITAFVARESMPAAVPEDNLIDQILGFANERRGGFGKGAQFPPHTTLLFLLYTYSIQPDDRIARICRLTLQQIQRRGLHDHLQGGIFRYCVDEAWTIPHFEKMLYDQALALWTFALAGRVLGDPDFRTMAWGLVRCLLETFAADGFFITAHDADTNHHEGATYLWRWTELQAILDPDELASLQSHYELSPDGNFEGQIHLIRRDQQSPDQGESLPASAPDPGKTGGIPAIEAKLLASRRKRAQPGRDDKILSGLNALAAIALIQAARLLDQPQLEIEAARLVRRILDQFWHEEQNKLAHAWHTPGRERALNDQLNQDSGTDPAHPADSVMTTTASNTIASAAANGLGPADTLSDTGPGVTFLFDAASLLTAVSFLAETDAAWLPWLPRLIMAVAAFRQNGQWLEASAGDFQPVAAAWFDHPTPASPSLAELGLARAAILLDRPVSPADYRQPFQLDFYNLAMLVRNGQFHVYTTRQPLAWNQLPANALQKRGEPESDCYQGACRTLAIPTPCPEE